MKKQISKKQKIARLKRRVYMAAGLAILLVLVALISEYIAPNDPYATSASAMRKAPCKEFLLGADNLGRCVFSRILVGAKTTIAATFFLVLVTSAVGTVIGMLCGYFGGAVDVIVMRIVDLALAFPQMVIAIAIAGILGGGMSGALISLGVTMWTSFARLARSHTLSLKSKPYIINARMSGKSHMHILMVHVLPNMLEPMLTHALTQIGTTIVNISGLSFLGLGVVPPTAEWGSMINESRAYFQIAPWAVLYPAVAAVVTILIFNMLGDAVMEYRMAGRRE